jgi:nucleotide-binding universal stress UspA family protein
MVRLWGSKSEKEARLSQAALDESTAGGIEVVIGGNTLDSNLVILACQIAKAAKRPVHLIHGIEVPRCLPLKAVLTQESEHADKLLDVAMQIAQHLDTTVESSIIQARSAGNAIVEEAQDRHFSLLLIGIQKQPCSAGLADSWEQAIRYVLAQSPCRICLLQDPLPQK